MQYRYEECMQRCMIFLTFSVPFEVTCINGGMFDEERDGCVCPSGFSGSTCEKGIK